MHGTAGATVLRSRTEGPCAAEELVQGSTAAPGYRIGRHRIGRHRIGRPGTARFRANRNGLRRTAIRRERMDHAGPAGTFRFRSAVEFVVHRRPRRPPPPHPAAVCRGAHVRVCRSASRRHVAAAAILAPVARDGVGALRSGRGADQRHPADDRACGDDPGAGRAHSADPDAEPAADRGAGLRRSWASACGRCNGWVSCSAPAVWC